MEILKHFTSPKQQSALRKLFSLPPGKSFLRLWNKNIRMEIYRNIQTIPFHALHETSSWASWNSAVQMLFLTPTDLAVLTE